MIGSKHACIQIVYVHFSIRCVGIYLSSNIAGAIDVKQKLRAYHGCTG